jgi:DHA2 family multidrug resistance protein-like MFS transporter
MNDVTRTAQQTGDVTSESNKAAGFQGNDKLLFGIILGVLTFWLFANTMLNIAPDMGKTLGLESSVMNIAVSLTSLFSGIFIVVMGGLADRVGRVKMVRIGFYLSILGSLLVAFAPSGAMASAFLLTGRALQGLSGACIMPASLALVSAYWTGAARQRAVSFWSIGSWGGSGLSALFGGLVAGEPRMALHLLCVCRCRDHRTHVDTWHA